MISCRSLFNIGGSSRGWSIERNRRECFRIVQKAELFIVLLTKNKQWNRMFVFHRKHLWYLVSRIDFNFVWVENGHIMNLCWTIFNGLEYDLLNFTRHAQTARIVWTLNSDCWQKVPFSLDNINNAIFPLSFLMTSFNFSFACSICYFKI